MTISTPDYEGVNFIKTPWLRKLRWNVAIRSKYAQAYR